MKIKKNGKVIKLTESDLQRIVKRVLNEQEEDTSKGLEYFKTNPTGTMTMNIEKPRFPEMVEINGVKLTQSFNGNGFDEFWEEGGQPFGKGFKIGSTGKFTYTLNSDDTITIKPESGNEGASCGDPQYGDCVYEPK